MLPRISAGKTPVIAIAAATLLLFGCSKSGDHSKGGQGTTNAPQPTSDTNTAAPAKTSLNPHQIAELKTKAEQGDADAQYRLAAVYGNGNGVPAKFTEALKWATRAAENGHTEAAYLLAESYHHGSSELGTNASLALHFLKIAAERGNRRAQLFLAMSYHYGTNDSNSAWGTGQDLAEAAKWYHKAAEQGDAGAQSTLGKMYLRGEGVPTNTNEGLSLIKQAIAKWGKEIQERLAATNYAHLSQAAREESAKSMMRLAAGDFELLGDCYYEGTYLPKDITNAIYWYEKAATATNDYDYFSGKAQFLLGYIHATETKNFTEAATWFRKRAEVGNQYAQYNLAVLVRDGKGLPQDWIEAAKWFRASAEQGNADAQVNLATIYRDGEGVPRDYTEAVKWIRKAAEQGRPDAQNDLAVAYAAGEGVPRDYVEAYKWYNLAAAGAENAAKRETSRKNLDGITRSMTPEQIAEAQRRSSAFVARKESASGSKPKWEDTRPSPDRPIATGTAFFITDDGYLLTCAHVVIPPEPKTADGFLDARSVTRIEVTLAGKSYVAKLVKVDKANDVAVLKVEGDFKALPLAPSRAAKLGEPISTLGFPNATIQGTEPKFTTGEINSVAGIQDDPRHFQVSVAVQPGNSGGPLLDSSGNVVGIVSARLADIVTLKATGSLPQNVNYALKSAFIAAFVESLPEVATNLKSPRPVKARPLAEIAAEAKPSVGLVTVY